MGAIGGLLGLNGGASGTGFQTPQQAAMQNIGVNDKMLSDTYQRNEASLDQQHALLNALQAQNGVGNQSNVFNQLQGVANGTGPNPAQAMLNQETGKNIANQAALMAGQRGASANAGLMARQAAQQGGALQQQAAGQGATMQANQSLNALNQMGGIAGQQVANQIGAQNAYTGANQALQGNLLNALNTANQQRVASQSSVNAGNAGLAQTGMQGQQALIGGLGNAAGAALEIAHGGQVPRLAEGGPVSSFGQFLTTVNAPEGASMSSPQFSSSNPGAEAMQKGISSAGEALRSPGYGTGTVENYNPNSAYAGPSAGPWAPQMPGPALIPQSDGGMVNVALSPGEKVLDPGKTDVSSAKTVPGKAKVSGDSLKNDTFKTKLPEGSIVIPRTKAKDEKSAIAFVQATLAKRGKK